MPITLSRRAISKARRSAVALARPTADRLTAWYLPRLARRVGSKPGFDPQLEALIVTSFQELYERDLDIPPGARTRRAIVDQFQRLYYHDPGTWLETSGLGVNTWKCPLDLWVYQEMLQELRPELIVECGTAFGGSASYLACVCDLVGTGQIVSIDIEAKPGRPVHPRITYLHGSSVDPDVIDKVRGMVPPKGHVLVILDSDHSAVHVSRELASYSDLVTVGSYLVVEDTNINGHPVYPSHGPGPMEAVDQFLDGNDEFVVDEARQKYHLTFNPSGFLRRVSGP